MLHIYNGWSRDGYGASELFRILDLTGSKLADELYLFRNILDAMIDGNLLRVSNIYLELFRKFRYIREKYEYENIVKYSGYENMHKQYKNLPQHMVEDVKNKLLKEIDKIISIQPRYSNNIFHMKNRLETIDNIGYIVNDGTVKESSGLRSILGYQILQIGNVFNDAYTIGRMLKNIYFYPDSNLLFLYVGEAHAKRVYDIINDEFLYVNFESDDTSSDSNDESDDDIDDNEIVGSSSNIETLVNITSKNQSDSYINLTVNHRRIIRDALLQVDQSSSHESCSYKS